MNYLICDHCQFKNPINTDRIIFCKSCQKKITNNYLDWKRAKFNSSFEDYINEATTQNPDSIQIKTPEPLAKQPLFKRTVTAFKTNTTKQSRIFIAASLVQLVLFFLLSVNPDRISVPIAENGNYLKDIKWGNYSISQSIDITLPFELKNSESVLPEYLKNYISLNQSRRSESSQSFSVTIEEFDIDHYYNISDQTFLAINDEYMKTPGVLFTSEPETNHLKIKDYQTHMQHGSYTLNDTKYLYDNYTLISGNKTIKIIVSYLKEDKLLRSYADIVSQSILRNKQMI